MKKGLEFICLLFLLNSCSNQELSPGEYIKWVEDNGNGLHKIEQIGDLIYDVQYKPTDYILCKTGEPGDYATKEIIDSLRKQYDSLLYFTVILKNTTGKDPISQNSNSKEIEEAALYYFQYNFQQDISMEIVDGVKTKQAPVLFHFERMYTVNNAKVFLLAFDKTAEMKNKDLQLIINSDYLKSGLVKFYFDKKIFNQQVRMKL